MISPSAIPYPNLHGRTIKMNKLSYSHVKASIQEYQSKPGYDHLVSMASGIANLANRIRDAAVAVKPIPFVGLVVWAVLNSISALLTVGSSLVITVAGLLVQITNELT